ncbi:hypothetical protein EDF46_2966 [Frondihabitans sp. PhB188]|uniref:hypothetical protein n=1 Tax=Frondihabitans sp. PhB188 TaxID=2485200 RepID=UPI000F4A16A4|nr:hypothetical protein [Frondihabitans sp. PhB188]ROQ37508.1 hypothetical protein EDF46_2966 [Frondihabitans sp. PhB188]
MTDELPLILRTADRRRTGLDDRGLRTDHARGLLHRVAPGSYVDAAEWRALSERTQYEVVIRAQMARLSPDVVVSHDSAAALWRMPSLDGWPGRVHVIDPARETPLTRGLVARHVGPLDEADVVGGREFLVTSVTRTALDLALRDGFLVALLVFDHALRYYGVTQDDLRAALGRREKARRRVAVSRAIDFASADSESPGESISHAQMLLLGFEPPELQKEFTEDDRVVARTDFYWSGVGVAGEFDGDEKYLSAAMRGGRSAEQVVVDEKWRTEELLDRHDVNRVVRWNYRVARTPALLEERLRRAGVPRRSPAGAAPPRRNAGGDVPIRRG